MIPGVSSRRASALLLVLLVVGAPAGETLRERASALASAVWQAQADDGTWRSGTYAMLRRGRALTPVMLGALLRLPASLAGPAERRQRGLVAVRAAIAADGSVGADDPDLGEYPTYATAATLHCLVLADDPTDAALRARCAGWLRACQRQEANGFRAGDAGYGGWGFAQPIAPGEAGHVDLAHTRWALQALRAGDALDAPTLTRALAFLARVQRVERTADQPAFDGGFYLSPVAWPANKGDGRWASYASATCDGLLALRAVGSASHLRTAAERWLADHPDWDWPAGIPRDGAEPWGRAVRCYHLAARAEGMAGCTGTWRDELLAALPAPRADGLVVNPHGALMKEDDPLVASALALRALAAALTP